MNKIQREKELEFQIKHMKIELRKIHNELVNTHKTDAGDITITYAEQQKVLSLYGELCKVIDGSR